MCYVLDHLGEHAVSKHSFKIRFCTLGHLTTNKNMKIWLQMPFLTEKQQFLEVANL